VTTEASAAPMNLRADAEIEEILADPRTGRAAIRAVDLHTHFVPAAYRAALAAAGVTHPDGYQAGVPAWSARDHLDQMDHLGIETSLVSISSPGPDLGPVTDTTAVARSANEAGARLAADHPGRFGFLATLPLPDVDASLKVIEESFDQFGTRGVALLTHTRGVYLGDQRLEPVMAELGRRRAVVLVHPTEPACLVPGVMEGWSRTMFEFFFDTTRAVTNLIFAGVLERHPGIRLVIPHAGAAIPALAQRIQRNVLRANRANRAGRPVPDYLETLRRCYFDVAGSVLPYQLASLRLLVPDANVLYGSDFPFTGHALGAELNADLRGSEQLSLTDKRAFLRDNALRLLSDD